MNFEKLPRKKWKGFSNNGESQTPLKNTLQKYILINGIMKVTDRIRDQ